MAGWLSQSIVIVIAIAVGIAGWADARVIAHDDGNPGETFSWTNCTWRWKANSSLPNIRISWSAGGFPGDSTKSEDGQQFVNSFTGRMSDAVGVWNAGFNQAGVPVDLQVVTSGANIRVWYENIAAPRGETWINGTNDPDFCDVHSTGAHVNINSADIYMRVRPVATDPFDSAQDWPGWFTQDNTRRDDYESCPDPDLWYTCDKKYDFGSTFVHELGHAVGWLDHPQYVDSVHLGGNAAFVAAKCGIANDQASLCPIIVPPGNGPVYRTHRRTLDAWDKSSLARIVEEWW